MRGLRLPGLLCALLAALPARAAGQAQSCDIEPTDGTRLNSLNDGAMVFIGGGAFFRCPGGVTIRSDSVAYIQATGMAEFIGRVRFQDTVKVLTAGYAQYRGRERHLLAQGDVVLRDLRQGAYVEAPHLNYFQASDTRPESLIQIHSGRPHAVLVQEGTEPGTMDTTVVDADAMDIMGEDRFSGRGNVVVTRADSRGYGNSALYDQEQGLMMLSGNARLESEEYQLFGEQIRARTDERRRIRELEAEQAARLESETVHAEAPVLRVFFAEGVVERLIAVGGARRPAQPGESAAQAVAISEDFRLVADSIDAVAPQQTLERVTAVGTAFGERLAEDTARARLPEVMARDWVRGDTIVATFVAAPPDTAAPADLPAGEPESGAERVLESILAVGGDPPASSVYRFLRGEDEEAAYNYLVANRIAVSLVAGAVKAVDAEGEIRGLYLEPVPVTAEGGAPAVRRSP